MIVTEATISRDLLRYLLHKPPRVKKIPTSVKLPATMCMTRMISRSEDK